MKQSVHTAVLVLLLSSADISASQPKADVALNPTTFKTPNIVLMLADDMSWFDVGAYHQRRDDLPKNAITPNIDKVAQQGMMFTRAFTATAMWRGHSPAAVYRPLPRAQWCFWKSHPRL